MVPVTTKPYLHSVTFILLQQGVPAFFLFIKNTISKYFPSRKKLRFAAFFKLPIPIRFSFGIGVTNKGGI